MSSTEAKQDEVDPCEVLNILCQKHSRLLQYATHSVDEAKKVLNQNELNQYKHEIDYISKQMINNDNDKNEQKNNDPDPQIIFHVTGFGEFHGVKDNPTTHLINNLAKYLKTIPFNVNVKTMTVLHVSGVNSLQKLKEIRQSNDEIDNKNNTIYVYLHFGVAASRSTLCIESVSYNCANFKGAPDQLNWEPINEMIIKQNKNIYHEYHTSLPCDILQQIMSNKGYNVIKSTDPGRYVCNWILYNSLHLTLNNKNEYSIFIHVPNFDVINQDTQCQFARDLIIEISKLLTWKHK